LTGRLHRPSHISEIAPRVSPRGLGILAAFPAQLRLLFQVEAQFLFQFAILLAAIPECHPTSCAGRITRAIASTIRFQRDSSNANAFLPFAVSR
jgi:hypothetical protein